MRLGLIALLNGSAVAVVVLVTSNATLGGFGALVMVQRMSSPLRGVTAPPSVLGSVVGEPAKALVQASVLV